MYHCFVFSQVLGYPEVIIAENSTKGVSQRENAKSAFLSHDETVWKRAMHAWLVFSNLLTRFRFVPTKKKHFSH